MVAPGTNAPLGSLIVPRREVVAIWLNPAGTTERIHRSTHPQSDRFTAVPPKDLHDKTACDQYGSSIRQECRLCFLVMTCCLSQRSKMNAGCEPNSEICVCFVRRCEQRELPRRWGFSIISNIYRRFNSKLKILAAYSVSHKQFHPTKTHCCCCICWRSIMGCARSTGCCARSTRTLQSSGMGSFRSSAGG